MVVLHQQTISRNSSSKTTENSHCVDGKTTIKVEKDEQIGNVTTQTMIIILVIMLL